MFPRWGDAIAAMLGHRPEPSREERARIALAESMRDAVVHGPSEQGQAVAYAALCVLYPEEMKAAEMAAAEMD